MSDTTWRTFADPRFRISLRYPDPTPGGQAVQCDESERDGAVRVHLRTPDRELYVEMVRFDGISPEAEYGVHAPYLSKRFGAGAVTDLRPAQVAGLPGFRYDFRWPEGERVALLLPLAGCTYRIIYNSASLLNERVVSTLEVRGGGGNG